MTRYIVDKRIGCVAVIDTEHSRYKDPDYRSNGLNPDLPYVMKYWHGMLIPDGHGFTVFPFDIEAAERLADALNEEEESYEMACILGMAPPHRMRLETIIEKYG